MNVYKVPHLLFPKKYQKQKTQNLLLRGDFVFIATNNLKKNKTKKHPGTFHFIYP